MKTEEKLKSLRAIMKEKGLDAWLIPSGDPHQSEYVAEHWKMRSWFSGFTGSAGICVVTRDKAGLWTDSRYWLQAEKQLSGSGIELYKMFYPKVPYYREWLAEELPENGRLGFDGSLLALEEVKHLRKALQYKAVEFHYSEDIMAELWLDRPPVPEGKLMLLSEEFSGESLTKKVDRIRQELAKLRADYYIISSLDEIAWLFNIRGNDISYNPVVISYAFLSSDDICLFINSNKVSSEDKATLEKQGVKFFPYDNIFNFLTLMPKDKKLFFDPQKTSLKLKESVPCELLQGKSIISRHKSIKNEIEQEGIRKAHIQDGIALVRFFFWLEKNVGNTKLDEYSLGEILHKFRQKGKYFQGDSFNPIIGYKGNGAIVHYSAQKETAAEILPEGLLLIDSGGQYLNGTTDVTRTISLGKITAEEKYYFTLVLAGHIDLAQARFPLGTSGAMLDTFTRNHLWQKGLNYGHGTGHGVGHYLCVHEGPQGISPRSKEPVLPGSVTTNEPGMYLAGKFGIRTENIMICQTSKETEYGRFCEFETVTLCPIDTSLIDMELLNERQKKWLNDYHKRVFEKLSPHLEEDEKKWLKMKTKPI